MSNVQGRMQAAWDFRPWTLGLGLWASDFGLGTWATVVVRAAFYKSNLRTVAMDAAICKMESKLIVFARRTETSRVTNGRARLSTRLDPSILSALPESEIRRA